MWGESTGHRWIPHKKASYAKNVSFDDDIMITSLYLNILRYMYVLLVISWNLKANKRQSMNF